MTEVEQITQTRTKWDSAKARLKSLMEGLEGSRAKRLDAVKERNTSVLNLVDAWMNDPEWRADIIEIGKREKAEDAAEVIRLRGMDEVIALITGQSEEEGRA